VFKGGRTELFRSLYTCNDSERLRYLDVTSLYLEDASDFAPGYVNEEQNRKYIRQYEEKKENQMKYDNIERNPGLMWISKIFLNSLFGKFDSEPIYLRQK